MFKKLFVIIATSCLSGCWTYYPYDLIETATYQLSYDPFFTASFEPKLPPNYPKEHSSHYKISTEHMNRFIQEKNNLEYCLLPELGQ